MIRGHTRMSFNHSRHRFVSFIALLVLCWILSSCHAVGSSAPLPWHQQINTVIDKVRQENGSDISPVRAMAGPLEGDVFPFNPKMFLVFVSANEDVITVEYFCEDISTLSIEMSPTGKSVWEDDEPAENQRALDTLRATMIGPEEVLRIAQQAYPDLSWHFDYNHIGSMVLRFDAAVPEKYGASAVWIFTYTEITQENVIRDSKCVIDAITGALIKTEVY